jgi:hypothetical protein
MARKKVVIATGKVKARGTAASVFKDYDVIEAGKLEDIRGHVDQGGVHAVMIGLDLTYQGLSGIRETLEGVWDRVPYKAVLTGNPDGIREKAGKVGLSVIGLHDLGPDMESFHDMARRKAVTGVWSDTRILVVGNSVDDAIKFSRRKLAGGKYAGVQIDTTGYLDDSWMRDIQEHPYKGVLTLDNRGGEIVAALSEGIDLPYPVADKKRFVMNVSLDTTRRIVRE